MGRMSNRRAYTWARRLTWLFAGVMALFAVAVWQGWPSAWIAPATSFACAEITRRICAESNPDISLRWRDLFNMLRRPDVAPLARTPKRPADDTASEK